MAADPKPKGTTPSFDEELIGRAVAEAMEQTPPPDSDPLLPLASRAANDDRQSIGEMLRSLQQRPGVSSFVVASVLSGVWLLAAVVFALLYLPDLQPLLHSSAAVPALVGLGAAAAVPVAFVFMFAHMKWRAKELRLVTESMASLALRLTAPQADAQDTIAELGEQMRRQLNFVTAGVDRAMARAGELETRVNGQVAALERSHREADHHARGLTERLAEQYAYVTTQAGQMRETVDAARGYSEKAAAMMQSLVGDTESRVDAQMRVLGQSLASALSQFEQTIEERSRTIHDVLTTRTQDMVRNVNDSGRDLAAQLDRRIKDASVILDARTTEIEETIGAKMEQIDKTMQHRLVTVTQTFDARIASFEDTASGRAYETASQIDAQTRSSAQLLDSHLTHLTQSVRDNAVEASGMIEARTKAASEVLAARIQQMAQAIDGRTAEARQSLGKLAEDVERKIIDLCSNAGSALAEDATTVESKLTALSGNIGSTLAQNAQYVERTLHDASANAARTITSHADQIHNAMQDRTSAIATTLNTLAADVTEILDTRSQDLLGTLERRTNDFTGEIVRASTHAASLIETKGLAFAQAVTDNGLRISDEITTASEAAIGALHEKARETESGIHAVLDHARESTTASLNEMREVHGILRTEGISMFERLREANVLLREALSGSHDSMGALETAIDARIKSLGQAVDRVSTQSGEISAELASHVNSFQDSGTRVVEDLTRLAEQFESHGHSLVQTVELIDNMNRRTIDTVSARSASLDAMIVNLDTKALDFEQRLTRFSSLLNDSLDAATSRTREIAGLIADNSSTGVKAIGEQYESMRTTIDHESKRTAEMLRSIYQSTATDAQVNLRQTAEHFTELLQDIKRMAADMQRDLEATREDLRRSVLNIPRETADSMTQMRQVIVGQVDALSELHRIIAKQSVALPAPRGEAVKAAAAAPAAERQGPPAPAPAAAPAASGKPGWLAEIMARSTGNGSQPQPPERTNGATIVGAAPIVQSLDGLASEIARMIDPGALGEAWDRYHHGERHVFTRTLYTLPGQRAFDEIRARYKSDRDFKHTVDRYMNEFERLVGGVSRDEQGQARMHGYLTSETGKVYTMLAHAAGRID